MAKKTAAEKLQDMLADIDELIEQANKDTIKEVREGLAAELVRDSKQNAEFLRGLFEYNEFTEDVTDYVNFRAGMRFAARLIAAADYEY